jgi:hypothetical protein
MERTDVRCYGVSGALDGETGEGLGQMIFQVEAEED